MHYYNTSLVLMVSHRSKLQLILLNRQDKYTYSNKTDSFAAGRVSFIADEFIVIFKLMHV